MDNLPEGKVREIWDRITRYIDPSKITATNKEDFVKQLESQMDQETKDKQGSMKSLVKSGFAERISQMPEILQTMKGFATMKVKPSEPVAASWLPPNTAIAVNNRYAVRTRAGLRYYAQKNIRIMESTWKGKPAYWVYNKSTKRRISWGLIKKEAEAK